MPSVPEIVKLAGGWEAVAGRRRITRQAILKWETNGIPDEHWPDLIRMARGELNLRDLLAANQAARRERDRVRAQPGKGATDGDRQEEAAQP